MHLNKHAIISQGITRVLKVEPCLRQHDRCQFRKTITICRGIIHMFEDELRLHQNELHTPLKNSLNLVNFG